MHILMPYLYHLLIKHYLNIDMYLVFIYILSRKWNLINNSVIKSVTLPDYPIYSCAVTDTGSIVCGGGSGNDKNSFIGNPLHILKPFD